MYANKDDYIEDAIRYATAKERKIVDNSRRDTRRDSRTPEAPRLDAEDLSQKPNPVAFTSPSGLIDDLNGPFNWYPHEFTNKSPSHLSFKTMIESIRSRSSPLGPCSPPPPLEELYNLAKSLDSSSHQSTALAIADSCDPQSAEEVARFLWCCAKLSVLPWSKLPKVLQQVSHIPFDTKKNLLPSILYSFSAIKKVASVSSTKPSEVRSMEQILLIEDLNSAMAGIFEVCQRNRGEFSAFEWTAIQAARRKTTVELVDQP